MPSFDAQPVLEGPTLRLRPLAPEDFEALYAVAGDPELWAQHPAHDRWRPEVFRAFFDDALASGGALVVERHDGEVLGSSRYFGYRAAQGGEVEIGWTFIARSAWGGAVNGEVKRLMLDHAFRFVETVIFLIGPENRRSRRAIEKLGARLRDAHVQRGGFDHVVYEVRRADWPPSASA